MVMLLRQQILPLTFMSLYLGIPDPNISLVNHEAPKFAPRPYVIDFIASLWGASVAKQNGRKKDHVQLSTDLTCVRNETSS